MLANPNDFYIGRSVSTYGEYNEQELLVLKQLLKGEGTVVEVGANIGTHMLPLAQHVQQLGGQPVAFEPQPFIFQNLCANLTLNGIQNVTVWPDACGTQAGTLHFPMPDYTKVGNFGAISMESEGAADHQAVRCVALNQCISHEQVQLLKIDVEGFELETLMGAETILSKSNPILYLENDRLEKSASLIEWLRQRGYSLWWHTPPMFNPNNYFGERKNIYGNVASFNMVGMHGAAVKPEIRGLVPVTDALFHPLSG